MNQSEENVLTENIVYAYVNDKSQKVYTPNLEFAKIMANKYETFKVFEEIN